MLAHSKCCTKANEEQPQRRVESNPETREPQAGTKAPMPIRPVRTRRKLHQSGKRARFKRSSRAALRLSQAYKFCTNRYGKLKRGTRRQRAHAQPILMNKACAQKCMFEDISHPSQEPKEVAADVARRPGVYWEYAHLKPSCGSLHLHKNCTATYTQKRARHNVTHRQSVLVSSTLTSNARAQSSVKPISASGFHTFKLRRFLIRELGKQNGRS